MELYAITVEPTTHWEGRPHIHGGLRTLATSALTLLVLGLLARLIVRRRSSASRHSTRRPSKEIVVREAHSK